MSYSEPVDYDELIWSMVDDWYRENTTNKKSIEYEDFDEWFNNKRGDDDRANIIYEDVPLYTYALRRVYNWYMDDINYRRNNK